MAFDERISCNNTALKGQKFLECSDLKETAETLIVDFERKDATSRASLLLTCPGGGDCFIHGDVPVGHKERNNAIRAIKKHKCSITDVHKYPDESHLHITCYAGSKYAAMNTLKDLLRV